MKTRNSKITSWEQIQQEYAEQKFNFYLFQKNSFHYKDIHGDLSLSFGGKKDLSSLNLKNRMTLSDLVSEAGVPEKITFKGVELS
jgi:hypothetical protein